jgi:hypothetical protein
MVSQRPGRDSRAERPYDRLVFVVRRWVTVVVLGAASLLVAVAVVGATSTTWTRVLPEAEGIQTVVTDAEHVYVVYSDTPGHVAAIDLAGGRVAWIRATAAQADLLAASGGLVWAASNLTEQLVTHQASDGRVVDRFVAPDGSSWDAITSARRVAYATSRASPPTSPQYLSTITGDTIRTVQIRMPSGSLCPDLIVVSGSLIAECLVRKAKATGFELARISPKTGALLAARPLAAVPETDFVAYRGALNTDSFVTSEPRRIERYSARTLKLLKMSPPIKLAQGGVAGSPAGIFAAVVRGQVQITRISPVTLTAGSSIPVPKGYDGWFSADQSGVFVLLGGRFHAKPQTLARRPSPG